MAEINFQVWNLELEHCIFAEICSLIFNYTRVKLSSDDGVGYTSLKTKSRQATYYQPLVCAQQRS